MIDIGANLCHDSFRPDREAILQRARDAGIKHIVVTGSCLESNPEALALAQEYPGFLFSTAGVHPHHAEQVNDDSIQAIRDIAMHDAVVASGEMGLDFFRDFCPHKTQESAFHRQLEMAAEVGKPLFLHQRDAHSRFLPILKDYLPLLPKVVVHCFTGTRTELYDYLDLDLYIGITGWICDERRGHHLLEMISDIPSDRLMIETDAPYLLPRNLHPKPKSRRNEPMFLTAVAEKIAIALGKPLNTISQETENTAKAFFNLT